ncbi:STAS domain-containing protein [Bacillus sp. ISL-18]|uniref:STAS domain-containing protein n=1 Tax=Bacillus sp. ISL-18 TaxID=2819118 RepID=UPI001BE5FC34|nr:STAS domain-containing protein [Bacillus sp. ISL-18]MBT2659212.1 STAS domain-containing protein [Bacillus sp. ISL-18]
METKLILKRESIDYINRNGETFDNMLLSEATNVSVKIKEILEKGNIYLLKNARKLIFYVVEQNDSELVAFANQEGIAWATHSLTLSLKLEWVQAIRRTLWQIINSIDEKQTIISGKKEYSELKKLINDRIDQFLNSFFLSYSHYKDEMINQQREMVEHLSVPIIPVSSILSVLPLIGVIDSYRIKIIEEKVLFDIAKSRIQTLVIDLSGIAMMEMDVISYFEKILAGISMMGCKAILTGMRPDLVKKMVHSGINFQQDAETRGTLQETLKRYL